MHSPGVETPGYCHVSLWDKAVLYCFPQYLPSHRHLCQNPDLHNPEAARYISRMSTVQEIEAAIPKLPPTDLAELRAWFDDYFKKVSSEIEKDHNERLQAPCESANRDTQLNREIEEWQSFDDAMPRVGNEKLHKIKSLR